MSEFRRLLLERMKGLCELRADDLDCLESHFLLLSKWNRKVNLTRVRGTADSVDRHYCESLFAGLSLPLGPLRIMDLGSGAGFPGVPVAVLRRDCEVVLVESDRRKAVFLRESARELANVRVFAGRAEELKESFDWGLSRAVAWDDIEGTLSVSCAMAGLLVKENAVLSERFFEWSPRIGLPWDQTRCLAIGRNVSRETSIDARGWKRA